MEEENFITKSTISFAQKIKNSLFGIVFGLVLLIVAPILLYWNEGRTVQRIETINDAESVVIDMPDINAVQPSFNGELVFAQGMAKTNDFLKDNVTGVSVNAIKLMRDTKYYQWVEKKQTEQTKNSDGSTTKTTTYSYEKNWVNTPVDSDKFNARSEHINNILINVQDYTWIAKNVAFGAFRLPENIINKISNKNSLDLNILPRIVQSNILASGIKLNKNSLNSSQADFIEVSENQIYIGENSSLPEVGDLKIAYYYVPNTNISILAQVNGNSFTNYTSKKGKSFLSVASKLTSKDEMFQNERNNNMLITWGLRLLGIILMVASFSLILAPISVLSSVIPFVSFLVNFGVKSISTVLGLSLSLFIIAIAWIRFRPLIGIACLAVVALIITIAQKKLKKLEN
ncbi:MAG: TMEM43 family protein [Candidatus Gastranaerophilales bacterium]